MPPRAPKTLATLCWSAALLLACGENATGPKGPATLRILAGGGVADTIGAEVAAPLVVEVLDAAGLPVPHAPLLFTVADGAGAPGTGVSPRSHSPIFGPESSVRETTDEAGIAAVRVRLGTTAGPVRIRVTGEGFDGRDSATITVLPGAPASLDVQPRDTSLHAARAYTLRIQSVDRAGNPIGAAAASLTGGDSVLALGAGGTITARRTGRDFTDVRVGGLTARVWTSVVPEGTIAVTVSGNASARGIGVVNADGSGFRMVVASSQPAASAPRYPRWAPDGTRIAYHDGPVEGSRVFTVDAATGVARRLTTDAWATAAGVAVEGWATYSPDGQWIYFSGGPTSSALTLWRVRADGGGGSGVPEQLTTTPQGPHLADASAFGTIVYYRNTTANLLQRFDAARPAESGNSVGFTPGAISPRVQPRPLGSSGQLAWLSAGALWVYFPQCSIPFTVSRPGKSYSGAITWSADGQWILGRSAEGVLELIQIIGPLERPQPIRLAWSSDYSDPDWKR